ncbi:MAG TPA: flavin reductase family protein, partial [Candidatus Binatus sp.]|nr:flavin reductase family protein [Candidatus Binatus sp.]
QVQAPLVAGCHANVECKLVNEMEVEGLYIFVGQAVAAHVDDQVAPVARFTGKTFRLDGPI